MLELPERLRAIVAQEYPRFSDAEYARRHRALQAVMDRAGVDHLLVLTDHRTGNAPQWVTGWPGTVDTYRVDIRVPGGLSAGTHPVRITAAWTSGLNAQVPVR